MGKISGISIRHQRAINQAILAAGRVPGEALLEPGHCIRALRSKLRMSQSYLARRSGVPQDHIARIEGKEVDARVSTLRRLFDALFCDLLVLPRARKRPSEALAERRAERPLEPRVWD